MKVSIVYIFPENGGNGHLDRAINFVLGYQCFPPGHDHDTVIICNGGKANEEVRFLFDSLPNVRLIEHDDSGFDIGGFQKAAKEHPCDLMVFFGGNTYFRRAGWLARMVQVYEIYGDGLYGCTGNQGDSRFNVFPHVRTTGWWTNPKWVNLHPLRVTDNSQRYPYEHGAHGISTWMLREGRHVWVAGWNDVRPLHDCDAMPEGFHKGTQANLLVGDRLTAPPYHSCP